MLLALTLPPNILLIRAAAAVATIKTAEPAAVVATGLGVSGAVGSICLAGRTPPGGPDGVSGAWLSRRWPCDRATR